MHSIWWFLFGRVSGEILKTWQIGKCLNTNGRVTVYNALHVLCTLILSNVFKHLMFLVYKLRTSQLNNFDLYSNLFDSVWISRFLPDSNSSLLSWAIITWRDESAEW